MKFVIALMVLIGTTSAFAVSKVVCTDGAFEYGGTWLDGGFDKASEKLNNLIKNQKGTISAPGLAINPNPREGSNVSAATICVTISE